MRRWVGTQEKARYYTLTIKFLSWRPFMKNRRILPSKGLFRSFCLTGMVFFLRLRMLHVLAIRYVIAYALVAAFNQFFLMLDQRDLTTVFY